MNGIESKNLEVHQVKALALTALQVRSQVNLIQEVLRDVMQDKQHYGLIPGCGDKPALFKAGAEKLTLTFRMAPKFEIKIVELDRGHRDYQIVASLYSISTGEFLGSGVGSCSTMETKYRYRASGRKCPSCGSAAIIKGKAEYGGGFVCFAKKGGCGQKYQDNDKAITEQQDGKVENPDIADTYNTVLKMGKKRSLVDAVLTVTAASDIFSQDFDETLEDAIEAQAEKPAAQAVNEKSAAASSGEPLKAVIGVESVKGDKEDKTRFAIKGDDGVTYWAAESFARIAQEAKKAGEKVEVHYRIRDGAFFVFDIGPAPKES